MTDWRSEFYQQIDDCETDRRASLLSAWECDFLASLRGRLDDKKELTPRQVETLDDIWNKATAKGWGFIYMTPALIINGISHS